MAVACNDAEEEVEEEEEDSQVQLFVELKYCNVCQIEQPVRTKHCKSCNLCVATFDHHCPWIGNCVGERNKMRYFIYLSIQFIQMIVAISLGMKYLIENVEEHRREFNKLTVLEIYIAIACFFTFVLSLFVFALLVFHTYLIGKALTSWEHISWFRISYLKVWPRKLGSPFTQGSFMANYRQFFCFPYEKRLMIHQWEMPRTLPAL